MNYYQYINKLIIKRKELKMDLATKKIHSAMESLQLASNNLENGNKRLSIGDLDFAESKIFAAKMILINQVKDEEGKF
jgi:hypothetical protein